VRSIEGGVIALVVEVLGDGDYQVQELAALKADIDKWLTDLAEGRVQDFDAARIIERGRKLLAARSLSA
jgi:hypothetical protein